MHALLLQMFGVIVQFEETVQFYSAVLRSAQFDAFLAMWMSL